MLPGRAMRTGMRSRKSRSPLSTLSWKTFLMRLSICSWSVSCLGALGLGGVSPNDESEASVNLGVVEGALAQEAVGQGAEEGDFAFDVPGCRGTAGAGKGRRGTGSGAGWGVGPWAFDRARRGGNSSAAWGCGHPLLRPVRRSGSFFRGPVPQASASTPGKAERGLFRGTVPQASASTPGTVEREFFRGRQCRGHPRGSRAG